MDKLISISELSKKLNLVDPLTKKPLNHTLRYWEREFKEIKPKKINNRRYYNSKQVEIIKMINFLIKNKGMTISGVKKLINSNTNKLDDTDNYSLKADYYKNSIKSKSKTILDKINKIKSWQKKLILKFVWFLKAILTVNLFITQKNLQKVKKQKINLNLKSIILILANMKFLLKKITTPQ